jgi:Winged helix DNA-binding domain
VTPDRLSLRALNRAALHRQLLLDRAPMTAGDAVRHLAGLQAQAPLAPYVGLWTRLAGFRHEALKDLLTERAVLRAHLMRNTVHLVDAADYVRFRPLYQPLLARHLAGNFGKNLVGVDLAELAAAAAALLSQTPLTRVELGARLAPRWPDHDPASLAYAASHLLPLVQVPPRGLWGEPNQRAAFFLASAWLAGHDQSASPGPPGSAPAAPAHAAPARTPAPASAPAPAPVSRSTILEQIVLRYLAAYGPASVADAQAWSGLTRLREVTERLGSRLRAFAGPDDAWLLDLPDAPRPDPDVPAPPRFLPEYDNLLLSYAERTRVIPHRRPVPLPPGHGATGGTLLVDGSWQADWKISQGGLEIRPFIRLSPADRDAIAAEGERLLGFADPAIAVRNVRFVPVRSG